MGKKKINNGEEHTDNLIFEITKTYICGYFVQSFRYLP